MRRVLVALLLLAGGAGNAAVAQEVGAAPADQPVAEPSDGFTISNQLPRQFYVSAAGTYVLRDQARQTNNGYGGTLALGWQFDPQFALELGGQYNRLSPATLDGLIANILFYPTGKGFYALGGGGYGRVRDQPTLLDYNARLFNVGVGYRWGPFKILGRDALIRTEALYRIDRHAGAISSQGDPVITSTFSDAVFNIGLVLPFGPPPHPPATAAPEPPPQVVPVEQK